MTARAGDALSHTCFGRAQDLEEAGAALTGRITPRYMRARTLHEHFPIESSDRWHGFDVQDDVTTVALHPTSGYEPLESSAGTASSSDLNKDDRRIAGRGGADG
jgi:hypothetical protein